MLWNQPLTFSLEKGIDVPHYYLTAVYTEALYILSDAGLQAKDVGPCNKGDHSGC